MYFFRFYRPHYRVHWGLVVVVSACISHVIYRGYGLSSANVGRLDGFVLCYFWVDLVVTIGSGQVVRGHVGYVRGATFEYVPDFYRESSWYVRFLFYVWFSPFYVVL